MYKYWKLKWWYEEATLEPNRNKCLIDYNSKLCRSHQNVNAGFNFIPLLLLISEVMGKLLLVSKLCIQSFHPATCLLVSAVCKTHSDSALFRAKPFNWYNVVLNLCIIPFLYRNI